MSANQNIERKAALILAGIALFEGIFVVLDWIYNGQKFTAFLGFAAGRSGTLPGWVLSALVTAFYVALSVRLPSVRANLFRPSWLKLLALAVAFAAGMIEPGLLLAVTRGEMSNPDR